MSAAGSHHRLRRTTVGGYRVGDVEIALAAVELTVLAASDRARGDDANDSR